MNMHYTEAVNGTKTEYIRLAFADAYHDVCDRVSYFFHNFTDLLKKLGNHIVNSPKWQLTGMLALVALACFISTLIQSDFAVVIGGDFKLQGIAFIYNGYDDWHYFFRTGTFPMWDKSGVLGVDNIGAYSFYYLFDPFFLILLIWPRAWLNQVYSVVMMLKIILAGLFFYDYLGSFKLKDLTKRIGAIAYSCCGWMWYYLWFFHMMEAATFLPLMLLGVENIIQKKDPQVMMVGMFLMGAVNYQFLAIFTVLCFIYAMFRFFQTMRNRDKDGNWTVLGLGFVSFLTGILLSCYIIGPAFNLITSMPRIHTSNTFASVFKAAGTKEKLRMLLFWSEIGDSRILLYKHVYPLESLIFMNNSCFNEPLTQLKGGHYDNSASSLYISAPLLLFLLPSLFDAIKERHWSELIGFVLVFLGVETPFMYFACGAFSSVPYGRWCVFASAIMITFVCLHLENLKEMPGWYLDVSFVVLVSLFIFTVFYCYKVGEDSELHQHFYNDYGPQPLDKTYYESGAYHDYYRTYVTFMTIYYAVVALIVRVTFHVKFSKKVILGLVAVDAIIMANISIYGQTFVLYKDCFGGIDSYHEQTALVQQLNKEDFTSYRIMNSSLSSSQYYDPNLAMAEGYNGVSTFCSTINYDSEDFFEWSRLDRNADSYTLEYQNKRMNLDEFLGNKYYLLSKDDTNVPSWFTDVSNDEHYSEKLINLEQKSNFRLYYNPYSIDRIFTYDSYIVSNASGSFFFDSDNVHSGANEEEMESEYLSSAIVDHDYYDKNQEAFASFTQKEARMNYDVLSSKSLSRYMQFHYAVWDKAPESWTDDESKGSNANGLLRTLDKNVSDTVYSMNHQAEIASDIREKGDASVYGDTGRVHTDGRGNTYKVYFLKSSSDPKQGFESKGENVTSRGYEGNWTEDTHDNGAYHSRMVIESLDKNTPLAAERATEDNPAYLSLGSNLDKVNAAYYLYGKDGKLLCFDETNYPHTNTYSWRSQCGFYVDEPVYKIIVLIKSSYFENLRVSNLYTEYLDDFKKVMNPHLAAFKNSDLVINYDKCDANTLDFTSSFSTKKLQVINELYAQGWSLTRTDLTTGESEKVPLFKAQGGFLGFINEPGEYHYVLSYYTPGLKTGLVLTDIGFISEALIITLWYAGHKLRKDYKRIGKKVSLRS